MWAVNPPSNILKMEEKTVQILLLLRTPFATDVSGLVKSRWFLLTSAQRQSKKVLSAWWRQLAGARVPFSWYGHRTGRPPTRLIPRCRRSLPVSKTKRNPVVGGAEMMTKCARRAEVCAAAAGRLVFFLTSHHWHSQSNYNRSNCCGDPAPNAPASDPLPLPTSPLPQYTHTRIESYSLTTFQHHY